MEETEAILFLKTYWGLLFWYYNLAQVKLYTLSTCKWLSIKTTVNNHS